MKTTHPWLTLSALLVAVGCSQPRIPERLDDWVVLGSYSAAFTESEVDRVHNIKVAAKALDGTRIPAGATFSFNTAVGERTPERGYRIAPTLHLTGAQPDVGGGVCQVSSVTFNAALYADLQFVERHPHSRRVRYLPLGRDAAIDYGRKDLKFRNPHPFPVVLRTRVTTGRLTISILAPRSLPYQVALEVGDVEVEQGVLPLQIDKERIRAGVKGKGISVTLYRLRKKHGSVYEKERIARSYYPL